LQRGVHVLLRSACPLMCTPELPGQQLHAVQCSCMPQASPSARAGSLRQHPTSTMLPGFMATGRVPLQVKNNVPLEEICRDGSLLAYITQLLTKERLNGVNMKPRSPAAALHNIRKALQVLRKNRDIPIEVLWCEEDIVAGVQGAAAQLLWATCLAFNRH
jgi:hypothetical protein